MDMSSNVSAVWRTYDDAKQDFEPGRVALLSCRVPSGYGWLTLAIVGDDNELRHYSSGERIPVEPEHVMFITNPCGIVYKYII